MTASSVTIEQPNQIDERATHTAAAPLPRDRHLASGRALWAGRVLSTLACLFLAMDASFKLMGATEAVKGTVELGYQPNVLFTLGVLQLVCLALYLYPRTSVLGALFWTGYLGGAVATHVRVAHPLFSHVLFPVYIAALLWAGLWLRDLRLRALLPWREAQRGQAH